MVKSWDSSRGWHLNQKNFAAGTTEEWIAEIVLEIAMQNQTATLKTLCLELVGDQKLAVAVAVAAVAVVAAAGGGC